MEFPLGAAKIVERDTFAAQLSALRQGGKKVVYTSGVFDLLHIGHLKYLEQAKSLGDILVVGVNSDASVREIKGELRPIVDQKERATLVAGLHCVDYVFIFSEKNNNQNITTLKPDIYVKAGDYKRDTLSSASIVESYGGKVELVKFEKGFSSSNIIDRIALRYGNNMLEGGTAPTKERKPAVFLDRDGTINEPVDYLSQPEQFVLIPGVLEALQRIKAAGYYLIITTNQPGIGLGYFTREDLFAVNRKFMKLLAPTGVILDKVYFCPHSDADGCNCRKPGTGMIDRACRDLPIDLKNSFVVGDMTIDLEFGKNAGVRTVLVQTGFGGKDGRFSAAPTTVVKDLTAAADYILAAEKK